MVDYLRLDGSPNGLTKHIDIKVYFLWDNVKDRTISLEYILSASMAANIFTKVFGNKKHISNQLMLGISAKHSELGSSRSVKYPAGRFHYDEEK